MALVSESSIKPWNAFFTSDGFKTLVFSCCHNISSPDPEAQLGLRLDLLVSLDVVEGGRVTREGQNVEND